MTRLSGALCFKATRLFESRLHLNDTSLERVLVEEGKIVGTGGCFNIKTYGKWNVTSLLERGFIRMNTFVAGAWC